MTTFTQFESLDIHHEMGDLESESTPHNDLDDSEFQALYEEVKMFDTYKAATILSDLETISFEVDPVKQRNVMRGIFRLYLNHRARSKAYIKFAEEFEKKSLNMVRRNLSPDRPTTGNTTRLDEFRLRCMQYVLNPVGEFPVFIQGRDTGTISDRIGKFYEMCCREDKGRLIILATIGGLNLNYLSLLTSIEGDLNGIYSLCGFEVEGPRINYDGQKVSSPRSEVEERIDKITTIKVSLKSRTLLMNLILQTVMTLIVVFTSNFWRSDKMRMIPSDKCSSESVPNFGLLSAGILSTFGFSLSAYLTFYFSEFKEKASYLATLTPFEPMTLNMSIIICGSISRMTLLATMLHSMCNEYTVATTVLESLTFLLSVLAVSCCSS